MNVKSTLQSSLLMGFFAVISVYAYAQYPWLPTVGVANVPASTLGLQVSTLLFGAVALVSLRVVTRRVDRRPK